MSTRFIIENSGLRGAIRIPPSKSHTLRAILFASLGSGQSTIYSSLLSQDVEAMIHAVRLMGAKVTSFSDRLEIIGTAGKVGVFEDVIQAGNSGIVLRFMSAVGALSTHPVVITGDASIRHQRPMSQVIKALEALGAKAISMRGDGYAPLIIQGPLVGKQATLSGKDSQPVSALLIACAFKPTATEIEVEDPEEIPWIELTLDWLNRLGIEVKRNGFTRYSLRGSASYTGFTYTVPGDFSSAAFPIAAALVTGSSLRVDNLDMEDPQGDKELIRVLQEMGAHIEINHQEKSLYIHPGAVLQGREVHVNNFIDAVPILAVLGCYAEGKTTLTGASVAREKESNRLLAISLELKKMGGHVEETPDGLVVYNSPLRGAALFSHHDHRVAMSLAIAALGASGQTVIYETDCVSKTYPCFAGDFCRLGAKITEDRKQQ